MTGGGWLKIRIPMGVYYDAYRVGDTAGAVIQRAVEAAQLDACVGWRLYWDNRPLAPDKPIPMSLPHPEVELTLLATESNV